MQGFKILYSLKIIQDSAQAIEAKYKNKHLIITGKKEIKITMFLKKLSKILRISKKIKFQNKKIIGHYEATPFTYKFKKGQIFKLKSSINIYHGISKLIDEIKIEKKSQNFN